MDECEVWGGRARTVQITVFRDSQAAENAGSLPLPIRIATA